jgi:hypothetical protein
MGFAVIQNEKLDITLNVAREKRAWPPIRLYLEDGNYYLTSE